MVLTNASNSFAGTIEFSNTGSQILEYTSAGALGSTSEIQFRNTGGTIGDGSVLLYTGTTDETVGQTLQCDTSIGMRLRSDSVGGSVTFNGGFSQSSRNLYLEGSGTGANTLASVFGSTGSLNKRDAGAWVVSSSATNSGGTNIAVGILEVEGGAVLGGGTIVIADGGQLILNKSNTYNAIARVNGPGVMRLRGGSGTISQNTANWVRLGNNNSGGFHLDMGASLSDRGDIVVSEIWGDGTVAGAPKLTW